MKHATATSKTERKREREGNKKEENFYYKRISHTYSNTHNIEGQGARRVIEEKRHMRK